MFVDYYIVGYTKHQKTFSKICVLENDFFCAYQILKNVFQLIYKVASKHRKTS